MPEIQQVPCCWVNIFSLPSSETKQPAPTFASWPHSEVGVGYKVQIFLNFFSPLTFTLIFIILIGKRGLLEPFSLEQKYFFSLNHDTSHHWRTETVPWSHHMSQHCAQVVKKAGGILACGQQNQGSHLPSALGTGETTPQVVCPVFVPSLLQRHWGAEVFQRRATKLVRYLEGSSYEEWLKEPELFSMKNRRLRGNFHFLQLPEKKVGITFFSQVISDRIKENSLRLYEGRFRLAIRKCVDVTMRDTV